MEKYKDMLNELSNLIHDDNVKKGFYDKEVNFHEKINLMISELCEGVEAHRKDRLTDPDSLLELINLQDNSLKDRYFEMYIKDTLEDELADTLIRLLDFCGYAKIDIGNHVKYKLAFNRNRAYRHNKNY